MIEIQMIWTPPRAALSSLSAFCRGLGAHQWDGGETGCVSEGFCITNGPLLIKRAGKSYVTAAPEATAGVDLGADLAQQERGSLCL